MILNFKDVIKFFRVQSMNNLLFPSGKELVPEQAEQGKEARERSQPKRTPSWWRLLPISAYQWCLPTSSRAILTRYQSRATRYCAARTHGLMAARACAAQMRAKLGFQNAIVLFSDINLSRFGNCAGLKRTLPALYLVMFRHRDDCELHQV